MAFPFLAVAQAGLGIFSSIAGFGANRSKIAAQNAMIEEQNKYRKQMYEFSINKARAVFNAKKLDYNRNIRNIQFSAAQAYGQESRRLAELTAKYNLSEQADLINAMTAKGKTVTRAQGVSSDRRKALSTAGIGRNTAIRQESFDRALSQSQYANEQTRYKAMFDAEQAYVPVSTAPIFGPAPMMTPLQSGPSPLNMLMGIGSSILGGISAFNAGQAPNPLGDGIGGGAEGALAQGIDVPIAQMPAGMQFP